LRVLGIWRRDIPSALLGPTLAQRIHHDLQPREVILSSWLTDSKVKESGKIGVCRFCVDVFMFEALGRNWYELEPVRRFIF